MNRYWRNRKIPIDARIAVVFGLSSENAERPPENEGVGGREPRSNMKRELLPIAIALAVAFALTAGTGMAMAGGDGHKKCAKYKYKIKHKPPGNPHNAQYIWVGSKNAALKHKYNHGDKILKKKCVNYKHKKKHKW